MIGRFAPSLSTQWFGHPKGLTILFLTQTWAEFSFYGMRALLVLYMTKHLMISQQKASWIYAGYAALVYFTPIFGGIIADRWLGRRNAVILGELTMAAGHFMMASENLLYLALATIALGNGLVTPTLPSQINSLYTPDDPRRASAYNIYYVGVNIGAFLAPLVIGTVGEIYNFHWGFALAGLGMGVGLVTYIVGARYLPPEPRRDLNLARETAQNPHSVQAALLKRFAILIAIVAAVVIFRGAYEQIGNTISLWADGSVDRTLTSNFTIPVTWFQALNPLMVFVLTPILIFRWMRLSKRNRGPSSIAKMVTGAGVVGVSYLMIAGVAWWAQSHGERVSWIWLALFIIVMTAGELHILPVGLGLFGRLAPKDLAATTIATWFLASAVGNLLAGWVGTLWTPLSHGAFFLVVGCVALLAAGLLSLLDGKVGRLEQLERSGAGS